ncbi:MAG: hypothetical protein HYZ50_10190 [Deltaproteobacteria bacterium]|nr:hypothetical protein [Deltaproteobacteria bacterium]
MQTVIQQGKRIGIGLVILTLICGLGSATAEEKKAKTVTKTLAKAAPKPAKAAKSQSQAKATPEATPEAEAVVVVAISEDAALALFDTFTVEWMKKLEETEQFHKTKAQVTESADGFSAEYTGYLPPRYTLVKKTESPDTPYVGILTYYEEKLRCTGKTKEEALQGTFSQVEQTQVSEIFRFTNGKWEY